MPLVKLVVVAVTGVSMLTLSSCGTTQPAQGGPIGASRSATGAPTAGGGDDGSASIAVESAEVDERTGMILMTFRVTCPEEGEATLEITVTQSRPTPVSARSYNDYGVCGGTTLPVRPKSGKFSAGPAILDATLRQCSAPATAPEACERAKLDDQPLTVRAGPETAIAVVSTDVAPEGTVLISFMLTCPTFTSEPQLVVQVAQPQGAAVKRRLNVPCTGNSELLTFAERPHDVAFTAARAMLKASLKLCTGADLHGSRCDALEADVGAITLRAVDDVPVELLSSQVSQRRSKSLTFRVPCPARGTYFHLTANVFQGATTGVGYAEEGPSPCRNTSRVVRLRVPSPELGAGEAAVHAQFRGCAPTPGSESGGSCQSIDFFYQRVNLN